MGLAPSLYRDLTYAPEKDFAPVALVGSAPVVLLVNKDLPAKNLSEFVAYLKANPGKLATANSGMGTLSQVSCSLLMSELGGSAIEIPYRGSGPALTDLIAGHTQFMCDAVAIAAPVIKSGSVKALVVAGNERLSALPDVPAAVEAGIPGFRASNWSGIFAPRATPAPIVAKINAAIFKALADGKVKSAFASIGMDVPSPERSTQVALGDLVKSEIVLWKPIAKQLN